MWITCRVVYCIAMFSDITCVCVCVCVRARACVYVCVCAPQVSNMVGGAEQYSSRVEHQLSPCLAQLAVAAGKETLWKSLNQQLLLKTKHKSSQARRCSAWSLGPCSMGVGGVGSV